MKRVIIAAAFALAVFCTQAEARRHRALPRSTETAADACIGEQIDTFAQAFPTPYISHDQNGIIAIDVRNLPDASLGQSTCFATNIVVTVTLPDPTGAPDPTSTIQFTVDRLDPNQNALFFAQVSVANLNPDVTFVNFTVAVDALAEGTFSLHSERTAYLHIEPYSN